MKRSEQRLIAALRERPGVVVAYDTLIARTWPGVNYPEAYARQHLRELVHRIRTSIEDQTGVLVIATVVNRGYVWTGNAYVR